MTPLSCKRCASTYPTDINVFLDGYFRILMNCKINRHCAAEREQPNLDGHLWTDVVTHRLKLEREYSKPAGILSVLLTVRAKVAFQ